MKFLLDMGLARSTARFLRGQGHDAVHLREQDLQRLDDHAVIEKARVEGRVILTHDLDFGRLIALSQSHLPSVKTFRLSNMHPDQVNHFLMETVNHFSHELKAGALVSVNEKAIRVRPLPTGTHQQDAQ